MKLTAFIAALLLGTTAMAQQAAAPAAEAPKPTWTFALHGFVSMSAAYQTNTFALGAASTTGQQTLSAGNTKDLVDDSTLTFDVRQSRFNFSVKGSEQVLFGATPSGVFEIDFFGGSTAGNYGNVSILPRLRVAYSELNWGAHKLQIGQQNDLIFAMAPTSLSHIGFPLGYLTGNLGWRRPGVFGYHDLPLSGPMKLQVAWEVGRSQWADGTTTTGFTPGEASGGPALEGRVTFNYGSMLTAWAAAHWNQADITGVGANAGAPNTLTTKAYLGGAKLVLPVQPVTLTLAATGFTGQNVGPLIGNFANFATGPGNDPDIGTMGYWAQLGVGLTKQFSLWALYGAQETDEADVAKSFAARAFKNQTMNFIAMYRDGGYGLSAEWINFTTTYATAATSATKVASRDTKADQFMVTANYFF